MNGDELNVFCRACKEAGLGVGYFLESSSTAKSANHFPLSVNNRARMTGYDFPAFFPFDPYIGHEENIAPILTSNPGVNLQYAVHDRRLAINPKLPTIKAVKCVF